MVVNIYQTGIHLAPTREAKTWKTNVFKDVKVHGVEDMHHITMVISSTSNRQYLSFQIIF